MRDANDETIFFLLENRVKISLEKISTIYIIAKSCEIVVCFKIERIERYFILRRISEALMYNYITILCCNMIHSIDNVL